MRFAGLGAARRPPQLGQGTGKGASLAASPRAAWSPLRRSKFTDSASLGSLTTARFGAARLPSDCAQFWRALTTPFFWAEGVSGSFAIARNHLVLRLRPSAWSAR